MNVRTSEQVKAEFDRKGISIAGWAKANAFDAGLVREVLAGRSKGKRGESHRIAVKLGLKEGEIVNHDEIATAINM